MYCEQKRKLFDLYLRFNQIMTPQKLRRQDWRNRLCGRHVEGLGAKHNVITQVVSKRISIG